MRGIADRLVSAGLAVPDGARAGVAGGVRQVRLAAVAVVALGTVALLMPAQSDMPRHLVALWFGLPLALTLSCLAVARVEVHPYSRWASPAGQRVLAALAPRPGGDGRTDLTSVAVHGIRAVGDPDLRAAFAHGEQPNWRQ